MDTELLQVIQTMVLESPLSATELSRKLKKPYSTLMRELNPNDKKAKLGVETLFDLIILCGDDAPLRYMQEMLDRQRARKTVQDYKKAGAML